MHGACQCLGNHMSTQWAHDYPILIIIINANNFCNMILQGLFPFGGYSKNIGENKKNFYSSSVHGNTNKYPFYLFSGASLNTISLTGMKNSSVNVINVQGFLLCGRGCIQL